MGFGSTFSNFCTCFFNTAHQLHFSASLQTEQAALEAPLRSSTLKARHRNLGLVEHMPAVLEFSTSSAVLTQTETLGNLQRA